MAIFRQFQGGEIQPATEGMLQAGAEMARQYGGAISGAFSSIAEGMKEYQRNSALNEQSLATIEGAGARMAQMLASFGDSPEYAPFVQQYAGVLEKVKKAPSMSMPQRLALANEVNAAQQAFGTDLQLYEFGKQKRLENLARQGASSGILDNEVIIGNTDLRMNMPIRVDKNVHQQFEAHRARYAEAARNSTTPVKPFDAWLVENADSIKQSINQMPNAAEDLKANALKDFDAYINSTSRGNAMLGQALENPFGVYGMSLASEQFAPEGGTPLEGALNYFDVVNKEALTAPSPVAATKAQRKEDVTELEKARLGAAQARLPQLVQRTETLKSEIQALNAEKPYNVEKVGVPFNRTIAPSSMGAGFLAYTRPETIRVLSDEEIVANEQARKAKIQQKTNELRSIESQINSVKEGKIPETKPETQALKPAVPQFGVANVPIGRQNVMGQMSTQQKRDTLRAYVASKAGFDSSAIDNVVNSMMPSTGPDIREIQTSRGPVVVMAQPDGKWTQLTGFAEGKPTSAAFGTRTETGWIPKTIKSGDGRIVINIAGEFTGSQTELAKFNAGLVDYMSGVSAAQRLREIIDVNFKSMPWNQDLKAEAENLVSRIKAAVRLDVVGTGAISVYEQGLLDKVIQNPTDFFSLDSANKARVLGILDKLESHLVNTGSVYGLQIKTNIGSANTNTEETLNKKYGAVQ